VLVGRSLWHGPDRNGRMEVEVLATAAGWLLQKKQQVWALRGANAATEFAMLKALRSVESPSPAGRPGSAEQVLPPVLEALLQAPRGSQNGEGTVQEASESATNIAEPPSTSTADRICEEFHLNAEQRVALVEGVVPWFPSGNCHGITVQEQASPVCLVHGPFGTGKSSLLIAMIHFIAEQTKQPLPGAKQKGPPRQILVAAHTNVAVDRILSGLVATGFTDIIRVGSLNRISDKSLLRYSMHSSDGEWGNDTEAELKQMLATATGSEAALIRGEIEELRLQGGAKARQARLSTAKVVGVTCCSASLPVMEGRRFEVLILDESSQMVEPLSLLPIITSSCWFLIAAGDPCQLPPVVASPAAGSLHGLVRPLFVRLQALGHRIHFLRRQYRCHPAIARIPNQQFYGGQLLDGCTAEQRPAVVPHLPPICLVDVLGNEQRSRDSASVSNYEEATAVSRIVHLLKTGGVAAEDIGVICFFRAQAQLIERLLSRQGAAAGSGAVQVATVDSFQGAERSVVILSFSLTRSDAAFSGNMQRLNVALTRAKHHLVAVGCSAALAASAKPLRALVAHCKGSPGGFTRLGQPPEALLHHVTANGSGGGAASQPPAAAVAVSM